MNEEILQMLRDNMLSVSNEASPSVKFMERGKVKRSTSKVNDALVYVKQRTLAKQIFPS